MALEHLLDSGSSLTCGGWWAGYAPATVGIRSGTTDRIDSVTDKSGNGWTLSNADSTDTDHPQLVADGWRFTANGDHHLKNTSFSQDWDSVTVFACFTFLESPHNMLVVSQDNGNIFGDFMVMLRKNSSGDDMDWRYIVGGGSAVTLDTDISDAFVTGIRRAITFIVAPTADDYVRLRLSSHTSATDSAVVQTYDSGEVTDTSSSGGMLGSAADDGLWVNSNQYHSAWYTAGLDLHELILFDGVCSATEITRIEHHMLNHGPPESPTQTPPGIGLGTKSRRS